jgi:hypothetical protein
MVSLSQGNKTLGVLGYLKNLCRIVNPDDMIYRRMEDQECFALSSGKSRRAASLSPVAPLK